MPDVVIDGCAATTASMVPQEPSGPPASITSGAMRSACSMRLTRGAFASPACRKTAGSARARRECKGSGSSDWSCTASRRSSDRVLVGGGIRTVQQGARQHGALIAERVAGAELVRLAGAHLSNIEEAAASHVTVLDFLSA
jgi:hypothetical protein